MMLAEEIDFHGAFNIHPTAMALLTADFVFVDMNEAFLDAVGRPLEELVGHNAFEVFPKAPAEPGNPKWTALEAAITSGQHEQLVLSRYDIEDPDRPGEFEERYWSSAVTPLRDINGQVTMLELSAREVTPIISLLRGLESEAGAAEEAAVRSAPIHRPG
jgi:PAS domain-containing protein